MDAGDVTHVVLGGEFGGNATGMQNAAQRPTAESMSRPMPIKVRANAKATSPAIPVPAWAAVAAAPQLNGSGQHRDAPNGAWKEF